MVYVPNHNIKSPKTPQSGLVRSPSALSPVRSRSGRLGKAWDSGSTISNVELQLAAKDDRISELERLLESERRK